MSPGGLMISEAVCALLHEPLIIAVVALETADVVIVKSAVSEPAGMVTQAGTVTPLVSHVKDTCTPAAGAGELITTVQDDATPPVTVAGLTVAESREDA